MSHSELYAKFGPKLISSLPGPKAKAAVEHDGAVFA